MAKNDSPLCDRHYELEKQVTESDMKIQALEELTQDMKETLYGTLTTDGLKIEVKTLTNDLIRRIKSGDRIWMLVQALTIALGIALIKIWRSHG